MREAAAQSHSDRGAWNDPSGSGADLRSRWLDSPQAVSNGHDCDVALYADGGYTGAIGATFAAQARHFGRLGEYSDSSSPAAPALLRWLPRYGLYRCGAHAAELAGMLCALRWRRPGEWNMFVGDRSALFSLIHNLPTRKSLLTRRCACLPLESLLLAIVANLRRTGGARVPCWRLDQQLFPARWHVQRCDAESHEMLMQNCLSTGRPGWY